MSVENKPKVNTPAMVSLNYLVMLHICEKILPSVEHPQELLNATIRESVSAFNQGDSPECDLRVVTDFLTTISGVDGLDYSEISVGELLSTLQDWWNKYKAADQPAPHVQQTVLKLIEQLPSTQAAFDGYTEPGHATFDQLIKVVCGESFSSIAYRVMENPFVGFTKTPEAKKDFYSITANIEFITDADATHPGSPSPYVECLPMIAISGNPARIGSSLKPALIHAANYLLEENFGAMASVSELVVCKNNKIYMTLPISLNRADSRMCEQNMMEDWFLVANKHPEDIYGIDFKKMKVLTSDPLFVDKLCEGLKENEQYYFKAGHFQADLGV